MMGKFGAVTSWLSTLLQDVHLRGGKRTSHAAKRTLFVFSMATRTTSCREGRHLRSWPLSTVTAAQLAVVVISVSSVAIKCRSLSRMLLLVFTLGRCAGRWRLTPVCILLNELRKPYSKSTFLNPLFNKTTPVGTVISMHEVCTELRRS